MQPEIDLLGLPDQDVRAVFALASSPRARSSRGACEELGKPVDWAYEMVFAALLGGLVGARLYWIVQNYDEVKDDLLGSLFCGLGARLVRRRDRRRDRRAAVGAVARLLGAGAARPAPRRSRSATRSGASAARSPATATTARRGTARGRWPIPHGTVPDDRRPCTRRRSTRRSRWAWSRWGCGACATACRPGCLFALYLVLAGAGALPRRVPAPQRRRRPRPVHQRPRAREPRRCVLAGAAVARSAARRRGGPPRGLGRGAAPAPSQRARARSAR